jgi:hypothetical protein
VGVVQELVNGHGDEGLGHERVEACPCKLELIATNRFS